MVRTVIVRVWGVLLLKADRSESMAIGSHVIPRFYLEQFATPSARRGKYWRVWTYQREKNPQSRTTLSQGYENGYFGFVRDDGSLDESLELKLSKLEDECNDVVVCAKSDLFDWTSTAYRSKLAFYMALLFSRATQRRNFSNRNHQKVQDSFAGAIADDEYITLLAAHYSAKTNQDISQETMRDQLRRLSERMQTPAAAKKSFLDDVISHAEIGKGVLLQKPWQVWKSSDAEFITSDNPLVSFVEIKSDVWHPGYGLTHPGVIVLFPLSPQVCLTMGVTGPYQISVNAAQVKRVNETVISVCDRFVYSRTPSDETKRAVDHLAGSVRYGINAFMPIGRGLPSFRDFMTAKLGLK
jgi:Protein of unknown function (DUF4238)